MILRIYTENKKDILKKVKIYFQGVTIYNTIGFWDNIIEKSIVIEIIEPFNEWILFRCRCFMVSIFQECNQKEILITIEDKNLHYEKIFNMNNINLLSTLIKNE